MFHSVPVAFSVPFFMFVAGRRRRMERDSLSLFAMLLISFVVWIYRVIEKERERLVVLQNLTMGIVEMCGKFIVEVLVY